MRGGFTGTAMLVAEQQRQAALAELAERTRSSFYASTADDDAWRHERSRRRSRRELARAVLTDAEHALAPEPTFSRESSLSPSHEGTAADAPDDVEAARSAGAPRSAPCLLRAHAAAADAPRADPELAPPAPAQRSSSAGGRMPGAARSARVLWHHSFARVAGIPRGSGSPLRPDADGGGSLAGSTHHASDSLLEHFVEQAVHSSPNGGRLVIANATAKLRESSRVIRIEEVYSAREVTHRSSIVLEHPSPSQQVGRGNSLRSAAEAFTLVVAEDKAAAAAVAMAPYEESAAARLRQRGNLFGQAVMLYTVAATRAVADARLELHRHADALRTLRLIRTQAWALLSDPESSVAALCVSSVVIFAIVISSATFCMETVAELDTPRGQAVFLGTENFSIAIFTAEYVARLLTCPNLPHFLRSWMNAVDLVAIVPYYVERGLASSGGPSSSGARRTRIVRIVRIVRVLRVLKLGSRFGRISVVNRALYESSDMLALLFFLMLICIVVCSSLIYYAERGTYLPEYGFYSRVPYDALCIQVASSNATNAVWTEECIPHRSPFNSIPSAFWWCIVTLMTVGYGDVVPITPGGMVVAGATMVCAVLLLSLPISVIGTEFTQQWLEFKSSSHMPDRRRKAPRFTALRRALAAHNQLLDEVLLKTRDVLFEIDDLMARVQDKHRQRSKEALAQARKAIARAGSSRSLASSAEASARDVKHETEMLFMELELKKRLMRLQELLAQAELLRDPSFLRLLEHCRETYSALRRMSHDVASISEEAGLVEEELEQALSAELQAAQLAADAAAEARAAGLGTGSPRRSRSSVSWLGSPSRESSSSGSNPRTSHPHNGGIFSRFTGHHRHHGDLGSTRTAAPSPDGRRRATDPVDSPVRPARHSSNARMVGATVDAGPPARAPVASASVPSAALPPRPPDASGRGRPPLARVPSSLSAPLPASVRTVPPGE